MDERILKLLGRKGYAPSNVPELLRQLDLLPNQQQDLQASLRKLETNGLIVRTKGNRYLKSVEADLVPGVIRINRQGKGFLQPDEAGVQEIAVSESETSTAMNGDRVLVRRDVKPQGLRPSQPSEVTGAVVRILVRKRTQIAGTLQQSKQFLYVIPDDPRIPHDIYVAPPRDLGRPAQIGDKVVVELKEWTSRHLNPEGEIIEVLGPPDAEGVDMLSVLRQYALPLHFPKDVLEEADAIARTRTNGGASAEDLKGRVDCRSDLVVTIDPDDAKDFDDAICLKSVDQGQWKLWVHIADVSHYVRAGSALDTEARRRGNSTYLVDRVIPMLPEALSNELCSLKPDTDRLTKCVEFLLSKDGVVLETRFFPAVIRSQRRFTYKETLARLQQPPADAIDRMLHQANDLAQLIRRARFKAGSLDLDFVETKIRLDERGRVRCIEKVENDVSHQLVEEYMLLANEAVAARLMQTNRPALYRVHEPPDDRRLKEYRELVLSHRLPCGNLSMRPEVQKLMRRLGELPIGPALKIGFLKSLMRARYAVEPLGHYGLNKAKYTHFTSPIRRYADLEVHRALFEKVPSPLLALRETSVHLSETERTSSDAERDSKDVKMFAYLNSQLSASEPRSYPGLVKEVRNFGFFVEVPDLGMSGLVHLSSIQDEFFVFDPSHGQLVGRRTRRIIKLGDHVIVHPFKVDSFKKQVDFQLVKSTARKGAAPTVQSGATSPKADLRRQRPALAPQGATAQRQRPGDRQRSPAVSREDARTRRDGTKGDRRQRPALQPQRPGNRAQTSTGQQRGPGSQPQRTGAQARRSAGQPQRPAFSQQDTKPPRNRESGQKQPRSNDPLSRSGERSARSSAQPRRATAQAPRSAGQPLRSAQPPQKKPAGQPQRTTSQPPKPAAEPTRPSFIAKSTPEKRYKRRE
jgi:ribonuclease R